MALNIPMPSLSGDSLLKGLSTGGNLFAQYMQPIIQREQLAETGKYHQGSLDQQKAQLAQQWQQHLQELALRKQAEARMGAMVPWQRKLAELQMQGLEQKLDPQKKLAYINQVMNGIDQIYGANQTNQEQENPINFYSGKGMPNTEEISNPTAKAPSMNNIQNGMRLSPEQRYQMGLSLAGITIPQSPQQKLQNDITKAITVDEAKINHKQVKEIEDSVRPVLEAASHLEALEKIFKEHPNQTGIVAGRAANIPGLKNFFDAATVKAINAHAVPLQGQIAGQLGKTRGYGVSKIAETAKPSATDTQEGNIGSLNANKEAVLESLTLMKEDYERKSGKKFPYKIPEFLYKNAFETNAQQNNAPKKLKYNMETGRLE